MSDLKKVKDFKSDCSHVKKYSSYIITSYPLKHSWICVKCGETGIDVAYNVIGLSYEELLEYWKNKR